MQNQLKNQTSPYLLQHADNPVAWYPWCAEAFERAKKEDKPIFLSIGYSTCHWCHVMAHESFEDEQVAEILNKYFISIKVDKEERPDIDSIYMAVCQAFTGSGGWPTTIFLTPEQKPFFAGTYFPKTARYGQIGLCELLLAIHEKWENDRQKLLKSADEVVIALGGNAEKKRYLKEKDVSRTLFKKESNSRNSYEQLIDKAVIFYKQTFDKKYGGFGRAPKFPTPHNLLFLMQYYEKTGDKEAMNMVEKTLRQMYQGGIFDHIGGGFSRYSTDDYFLVPHFEKMLYDNALLIMAYSKAYQLTKNPCYRMVAEKTANYVMREMTSQEGGFYSAQDADSEGVEGKYYLFEPAEVIGVLGEEEGKACNLHFDITEKGNFEGKSIPNLLQNDGSREVSEASREAVYAYRKKRYALHLDDKILTSWNGLMIAAMCQLYRVTENKKYLDAARNAQSFMEQKQYEGDTLYVSSREGQRGGKGFLDDYAFEVFALLHLYEATLDCAYLEKAKQFCKKAIADFYDEAQSGFFLYGKDNEQLIIRPKETYDGAVFSGNSAMAYNLVQLYYLTGEELYEKLVEEQLCFLNAEAEVYPTGHAMFLMALSYFVDSPMKITVVVKESQELELLPCKVPLGAVVRVMECATEEYPLKNEKTTYYVCQGRACQAGTNTIGNIS